MKSIRIIAVLLFSVISLRSVSNDCKYILAMPSGDYLAHVTRPLEIAKELRTRGHRVVFASDGKYMHLVKDSGFEVRSLPTLPFGPTEKICRDGFCNFYSRESLKATVNAERALLEEQRPDLVLSDFRISLGTSAELAEVPHAAILNASWTHYFTTPVTAPEHFFMTAYFGKWATTKALDGLKTLVLKQGNWAHNQVRRDYGLAPTSDIFQLWSRNALNLLADIPAYAPTANLPLKFHYVGPLTWSSNEPAPEWLQRFDPKKKKLVYITMGSTGDSKYLAQAVKELGNGEFHCALSTANIVELGDVPPNVTVATYLPGDRVIEKASAVVCQGGNGTIYQTMKQQVALAGERGIGLIGIPTQVDQEWNLEQVASLGLGKGLSDLKYKEGDILRAVEEAVAKESFYQQNAARIAPELRAYQGAPNAADVIERFLGIPPSPNQGN